MPCRDYYDDHPEDYYGPTLKTIEQELNRAKKRLSFAESALCAALNALTKDNPLALDTIDFAEAGINQASLVAWWKNHILLDAKHRAEEEQRRKKAAERAERRAARVRALELAEYERLKKKFG